MFQDWGQSTLNKKKNKGVATCYLNLLVISSCCFDTNSEFTEMFLMIHLSTKLLN